VKGRDKRGEEAGGQNSGGFSVIPKGELPCVWMLTGDVTYKLCDRGYKCETCPLDIELRHTQRGSPRPSAPDESASGVGFYHYPSHVWVQLTGSDTALVGVDQFLAVLLAEADGVVLPKVGTDIHHSDWIAMFVFRREVVDIPSPISGIVVDTNVSMTNRLDALARSSYEDGWLVEVRVPNIAAELEFSIPYDQVDRWLGEQMQNLDQKVGLAIGTEGGLNTLAQDGLLRFDLLKKSLGSKKYAKLIRSLVGAE